MGLRYFVVTTETIQTVTRIRIRTRRRTNLLPNPMKKTTHPKKTVVHHPRRRRKRKRRKRKRRRKTHPKKTRAVATVSTPISYPLTCHEVSTPTSYLLTCRVSVAQRFYSNLS